MIQTSGHGGASKKQIENIAKGSDEKAKNYFILGIAFAVFVSFFASFLALSIQLNFPIEQQKDIVTIITFIFSIGTLYFVWQIREKF